MKRTTATGNDNNRYTEGNPALNIPATVVGAEEMNNIQEEIVNVVLAAGLTLDGGDENQLLEAINELIAAGGSPVGNPGSPNVQQSINDNIGTPTTITGLDFDGNNEVAAFIKYHIVRRDDGQNAVESGELHAYYNTETDTWSLSQTVNTPDAQDNDAVGVTLTINAFGQIQYVSSNYGGAGYTGTFRASVQKIAA